VLLAAKMSSACKGEKKAMHIDVPRHSIQSCAWIAAVFLIVFLFVPLSCIAQTSVGSFSGSFAIKPGAKKYELVEASSFTDPQGQRWDVPAGSGTDGASIPRVFWVYTGHPYETEFVKAAIVHDYYCEYHKKHSSDPSAPYRTKWEAVHEMFYYALRANGTPEPKAKLMYAMVYYFGPRWFFDASGNKVVWRGILNEQIASKIKEQVELYDPPIGAIPTLRLPVKYGPEACFDREGVFKCSPSMVKN
jgi:hypothetical protein